MGTQSGNRPLAGTMIAPLNTAGLNVRFTPRKRTSRSAIAMSALCHFRTLQKIAQTYCLCRKPRKSRGSSGSDQPRCLLVQPSRFVVGMLSRLINTQDRSKTDIASLKEAAPMIAGIACEQLREVFSG